MSSFQVHVDKHNLFKKDSENNENSSMTRIETIFESCFHLIEACCALQRVHVNKHQDVRKVLEENPGLFGKETGKVWSNFQEIENQIRPGQAYGGKIDGVQLKRCQEIQQAIGEICYPIIRKHQIDTNRVTS